MNGNPLHFDDVARAQASKQFKKACQDLFGFGPEHLKLQYNTWNISLWNQEDMKILEEKPRDTLKTLDAMWKEISSTDRNTTIKPISTEIKLGLPRAPKSLLYSNSFLNIIPTSGLIEMAKRGTAETATTTGTTHGAVGTGTTSEALADVGLETERDRKEFDTDGTRAVSGTTERYGLAFSRSDFAADYDISEAALLTKSTGGWCIARVVATPVTVTTGRIMTMQVDITHINGTEV